MSISCHICYNKRSNKLIFVEKAETDINDLNAHPEKLFKQMRCSQCKVLFIDSKIDQDFMSQKFSLQKTNDIDIWLESMIGRYENKRYNTLLENVVKLNTYKSRNTRSPKILDIGCSIGTFLLIVKKMGWDPYGVELHPVYFSAVKRFFGKKIYPGEFLDIDFKDLKFNFITLFEVLEHTTLPLETLLKAKRLLSEDGVIAITVPTSGHTYLKYLFYKLVGNIPGGRFYRKNVAIHGHITNFSSQSVYKIAENANLEVAEIECIKKDGDSFFNFCYYYLTFLIHKLSFHKVTLGHTLRFILKPKK